MSKKKLFQLIIWVKTKVNGKKICPKNGAFKTTVTKKNLINIVP